MRGRMETLPLSVLQEILNRGLGAVDLARLESCSPMFRAPSGVMPCESKSVAEAAAHRSCQAHPVFENFPSHARLALLARCEGHWKQVLYFLECVLHMRGHSALAGACRNVVATAGYNHSLIVNGKGELYITSRRDTLPTFYEDIDPEPQSTLRLIFSQPTSNRILQISIGMIHAAFVTETGQVFTFGLNNFHCCGLGMESNRKILKPTLVTALEMIPCQQVMTGMYFTIALTRSGALYSWGWNFNGQLGLGHTHDKSIPHEVIVESDNGARDLVVQVSAKYTHVVAVKKAGRLFTWSSGYHGCLGDNSWDSQKLRPKQVQHGGFAKLFIVSASAGYEQSAAIDSSGLVYTWGMSYLGDSCTPVLIDSLKAYRAVKVVASCTSTYVVLNNGQVHYFINNEQWSHDKKRSGSFTIRGHKIQSITSGYEHIVMVTMEGAVFGFGRNNDHQLGVVDPSALSSDKVLMPTEVFDEVTKFKRIAKLPVGKELQWQGAQKPL